MIKSNSIIKLFCCICIFTICINSSFAQKFYVTSSLKEVPENFTFDISFTVENGNLDKFTPPNFNGFDVYGPSQSQNISIINGNVSKSFSYTYTLQPKKQGSFTINPANAVINGKTFSTQPIAIKVIAPQQKQTQNRRRQQNYDPFEDFFGSGESQRPSETEIKKELNEGIFVRVTPSKTTLYEGDQVTLSYKLYFRLRYDGLNAIKMPTYNGFLSEDFDIPIDQQKEPEIEVYNGKKYYVQEFKRVALFPQKVGKTTIDPMSFSCVVGVEVPNNFNPFFSDIEPYEYNFNSNAVQLEVLSLPTPQPKNFSGAVGKFNFQASYDKTQVKVGEPIKLKITYNGTGNLRLISAPKLTFPEEFEAYEPKLNENYASKGNIISGTKSYEYTLIPQDGGTFKLPEYEFGYFDLDKKAYTTFKLPETEITVTGKAKLSENIVNFMKREKKDKASTSLRGNLTQLTDDSILFNSSIFWALSTTPLVLFLIGFFLRKREYNSSELILLRKKKANAMALNRLKTAKKLMTNNNEKGFYDEVIRALLQYVSDKLHIPMADLSKENISLKLSNRNISVEKTEQLKEMLTACEMSLFASINKSDSMKTTFQNAIDWIINIDEELSKIS